MALCSSIRQFHPSSSVVEECAAVPEVAAEVRRRRGRPTGSRTTAIGEAVRHNVFLGLRQSDYPEIPPAFWNLLCSLTTGIFRSLTGVARQLRVEAPGHEQERILFRELPKLLTKVVLDVATWWWSYDRGFMGSTLRCPICGAVLKFRGDTNKGMGTPFGMICPRRSYYQCANKNCRTSICPLDQRLGLDGDSFLPCLQEIVVWLTSLDSYGKSLQFVGKLLNFSISHRSAWKLTQKIGEVVKKRLEKQVAQAFADPRNVVLPKAEVAPPDVGVVIFDGTCGRVDKDKLSEQDEPDEESEADPDAPPRSPSFREIKLGLVAHLVPPTPKKGSSKQVPCKEPKEDPALKGPSSDDMNVAGGHASAPHKKHSRKVRPPGEEPTLTNKKLSVHLGSPLLLFQMVFLQIHRLGLDKARTILVIGDGAHWIWKGVRDHLSSLGVTVVEILDYWHGVEHLWKLANSLFGQGTREAIVWVKSREGELLGGRLPDFFKALEEALEQSKLLSKDLGTMVEKELNYFRNNEGRIDYARYLAQGYLIGSGAMEGSCKNHVKERIDRAGMHWSVSGVMAVLRNRTLIKNGEWDEFWKSEAEKRWGRYRALTATMTVAA